MSTDSKTYCSWCGIVSEDCKCEDPAPCPACGGPASADFGWSYLHKVNNWICQCQKCMESPAYSAMSRGGAVGNWNRYVAKAQSSEPQTGKI